MFGVWLINFGKLGMCRIKEDQTNRFCSLSKFPMMRPRILTRSKKAIFIVVYRTKVSNITMKLK